MAGFLRRRAKPDTEKIQARVAKYADAPAVAEGVQPLNPGFFQLERMRSGKASVKRSLK